MNNSYRIAVTGSIAVGKTTLSQQLVSLGQLRGIVVRHIDVDKVRAEILESTVNNSFKAIQSKIIDIFGVEISNTYGGINRRRLAEILFPDKEAMDLFSSVFDPLLFTELTQLLAAPAAITILEWALVTEKKVLSLTDYNVLLVKCSRRTQLERLSGGDLGSYQIRKRIRLQYCNDEKEGEIRRIQRASGRGDFYTYSTDNYCEDDRVERLFEQFFGGKEDVCNPIS